MKYVCSGVDKFKSSLWYGVENSEMARNFCGNMTVQAVMAVVKSVSIGVKCR